MKNNSTKEEVHSLYCYYLAISYTSWNPRHGPYFSGFSCQMLTKILWFHDFQSLAAQQQHKVRTSYLMELLSLSPSLLWFKQWSPKLDFSCGNSIYARFRSEIHRGRDSFNTYEPNRISLCAQGHLPTNRPCNEISSFQILYQYPELLLNILHYLLLNYNFKAQAKILCMDLKDSKCSGWLRVSSLENSLKTSLKTQTYAIRLVT